MTSIDGTRVAFLQQLTRRHESLIVWKHLDRALLGRGDVDAAAPKNDVSGIRASALAVASDTLGATHVITCNHVADKYLQFFVQPSRLPHLFEFDVCTQPSRGLAPWAHPAAMAGLATVRPDGIRALRSGAEAVVSIVYHGLSVHGSDRLGDDERDIVMRGLTTDLDAAAAACSRLPPLPARRPLHELIRSLADGRWDRAAAVRAYAGFVSATLAHPLHTSRRMAFRARIARGADCLMSRLAQKNGRCVPAEGLDHLLTAAVDDRHVVTELVGARAC